MSDELSWQNATSPSSTAVGAPLPIATPMAVAMTPSMPLAPRLACTVMSLRGVPNHSTSRTGIDEATTRWPSGGTLAVIARATPGSDKLCLRRQVRVDDRTGDAIGRHPLIRPVGSARWSARCKVPAQQADRCMHLAGADEVGIRDRARPATRRHAAHRTRPATGRGPSTPVACPVARRPMDDVRRRTPCGGGWRRNGRPLPSSIWHPDNGSASTGQPVAAAERLHRRGIVDTVPGNDHTVRFVEQFEQIVDGEQRRTDVFAGVGFGQVADDADQRLTERQVEMDRPWPITGRPPPCLRRNAIATSFAPRPLPRQDR